MRQTTAERDPRAPTSMGGPRPALPARPNTSSPSENDSGYFEGSDDPTGTKGNFSLRETARVDAIGRSANADAQTFEAAGGGRNPIPRHEFPPTPSKTEGPFPAPLD
jgi:hypothetical protein